MQIHILTDFQEAARYSKQWNKLLTCCNASHVPFLRFEYLNSWWEKLGGGEWSSGELMIIIASEDSGELVGIAPLFFTNNLDGDPALMLLGSIEISDYLDFIVKTEYLNQFTLELCRFLETIQNPEWRLLDLYNLPQDSPTLQALRTAGEKLGWSYHEEQLQPCPYIPLKGDWDAYLQGLDKKQRHEIRRKLRRAEQAEPPVRWYMVDDPESLDHEIDDFLELMAHDPKKAAFLGDAMQEQLRTIMHAAFKAGWLQLSFLTIGDKKAASYLNFDYGGHIWVYNSGLDYEFRDLSPGWVLLAYLLLWANNNGREIFDMMRGSEDYKYRFGAIDRYIVRACLHRDQ